jgi:cobalt-zinc-cadmium efflux system membrane fusion protein
VDRVLAYIQQQVAGKSESAIPAAPESPPTHERNSGNDAVVLREGQAGAIGLSLQAVSPQVDPIKLELTGRTAYDPNSLYKVRPRFDTLVETVHAELGQLVHIGDPLVELHSVDLAAAKNDLQSKFVQWQRDLRVLKLHEKLADEEATSRQTVIDDKNAENKSHLDYLTSREKLQILGVPDADIDPLIKRLSDSPVPEPTLGTIIDKAKMILRSRVDGIVIQREVVKGNFYDDMDVLMVIAPLDHLWVLANVYEVDQAKVAVNQKLEIHFPFLQQTIQATVEFVSSEVSRETRAVQIRASIPNRGGRLKSDMLVKVVLQVPPVKGQTVVPRAALVVINGNEYVFVKDNTSGSRGRDQFRRRTVTVAQENSDFVVIAHGLDADETVATTGSLILAQLYEDAQMVATGVPVQ